MQGGAGTTCGELHVHMLGHPGDMGVLYERKKKRNERMRERRRHENNTSSQQHYDKDRNDTHAQKLLVIKEQMDNGHINERKYKNENNLSSTSVVLKLESANYWCP